MTRILVTGSDGFIGKALCQALLANGSIVNAGRRSLSKNNEKIPGGMNLVSIGDLESEKKWEKALYGVMTVVHLAGRAHVLKEIEGDPLAVYRRVNVEGAKRLALAAAKYGVRRFVYVSTIGVNGSLTTDMPFTEQSSLNPHNDYAMSKLEAEQTLLQVSVETGMELVIVRPPLVYGPSVKANFLRLLQLVESGIPLPLAQVDNRRSMVALDNLVDFLVLCTKHPCAAGHSFLVSDGNDVSTPRLIDQIARNMDRPARLFPLPLGLLRISAKAVGKTSLYDQLCGSLQVNIDKAEQILGWKPRILFDEGLSETITWYQGRNNI